MSAEKKNNMTREQAEELYRDLQKSMATLLAREAKQSKKEGLSPKSASRANPKAKVATSQARTSLGLEKTIAEEPDLTSGSNDIMIPSKINPKSRWHYGAVFGVISFASLKVLFGFMEVMGLGPVQEARATYISPQPISAIVSPNNFSREEVEILKSLDSRRADLKERSERLEERERQFEAREREFATKIVQLRDLTGTLKIERERNERRKNTQLEHLANVYGSMHPGEAAPLIEQLDVTIGLALLERMPEKRIGQILALMSPERALTLTRLLSGNR
jgi:flagellar motility protein MotE (MotC chaperone)